MADDDRSRVAAPETATSGTVQPEVTAPVNAEPPTAPQPQVTQAATQPQATEVGSTSGWFRRTFFPTEADLREQMEKGDRKTIDKAARRIAGRSDAGMSYEDLREIGYQTGVDATSKQYATHLTRAYVAGQNRANLVKEGPVTQAQMDKMVSEVMKDMDTGKGGLKGTLLATGAGAATGAGLGMLAQVAGNMGSLLPGKHRDERLARKEMRASMAGKDSEEIAATLERMDSTRLHRVSGGLKIGAALGGGGKLLHDGMKGAKEGDVAGATRDAIEMGLRDRLEARGIEVEPRKDREQAVEEARAQSEAGYAQASQEQAGQYVRSNLESQSRSAGSLAKLAENVEQVRGVPEDKRTAKIEELFAPKGELTTVDVNRSGMKFVDGDGNAQEAVPSGEQNKSLAIIPEGTDIQAELAVMQRYNPDVRLVKVPSKDGRTMHDAFLGVTATQASAYSSYAVADNSRVQVIQKDSPALQADAPQVDAPAASQPQVAGHESVRQAVAEAASVPADSLLDIDKMRAAVTQLAEAKGMSAEAAQTVANFITSGPAKGQTLVESTLQRVVVFDAILRGQFGTGELAAVGASTAGNGMEGNATLDARSAEARDAARSGPVAGT